MKVFRSHFSILAAILVLALTACAGATATTPTSEAAAPAAAQQPTPTSLPQPAPTDEPTVAAPIEPAGDIVLDLIGNGMTQTLTLADLQNMPASEGQAGIKSSTGKITLPTSFKGVALLDLANLVGGAGPGSGVNVEAEDGYAMTFSYEQLAGGDFIAYDPATGEELKTRPALTVLVAYEMDGAPLDAQRDGVLRLALISDDPNQVTDGHWSVKWVRKITVKPLVQEWSLELEGAISQTIDRGSFESCANCHTGTWSDDAAQEWVGVPLWWLAGYVDDDVKHDGPAFNDALADAGYTIEVIASDGYAVTFDSARVKRNDNIIVAFLVNGNPLEEKNFPLRIVGADPQKNERVGGIAKIVIHLENTVLPTEEPAPVAGQPQPAPEGGDFAIFGLVEQAKAWLEADLRSLEVVSITAEHPKKGTETYEGVRLSALLELVGLQPGASTLVITAIDGFSAEVALADVQACADCLVAFTNTPGKVKMVMPGLPSNLWVKDVITIEIK